MRSKRTKAVPGRLEAGRRRFEAWRRARKRGARIPERLWRSATKLAGEYGVGRTAKVLGLDYRGLKKRVCSNPVTVKRGTSSRLDCRGRKGWVGSVPATAAGVTSFRLECRGLKKRVQGVPVPDIQENDHLMKLD